MKTLVIIGLTAGIVGAHPLASAGELFEARLTGDQEVPPVVTDTTGRFEILFDAANAEGEYTLRVASGVRVTQSHFHCGPAGANGPIIVFLAGFHERGWNVDGKWVSNATITNANVHNATTPCGTTLADFVAAARSGNVYVNVHSVTNPGGVIRGQLLPVGGN